MSNRGFVKTALSMGLMAACSVVPTIGFAQEESLSLEEVVVTARKKSESIQDIPVSVTALGEELKRSSIRNLQDIQGFIPNVVIDRVAALQGGAAISIRGISYQETDKSWDAPIGLIVDGVFIGTNSGQLLDNFDIERIEVLRGPQGTLFGKNTNGGAINVIRTAPTQEFGGKVKVTAGDFGTKEIRGLINLPVTDKGGLKLFASKLESDGYIKNTTYNDDAGGTDSQNIGLTFGYDFTDNFELAFTAERLEDESDVGAWANYNRATDFTCISTLIPSGLDLGAFILPPSANVPQSGLGCKDLDPGSDEDHSSQNAPNSAETTQDFFNLSMNWALGDWTLTSITGYLDRDEKPTYEYDASPNEFLTVTAHNTYEQTSQEFRITGDVGAVSLTGGLYYFQSEYTQSQTSFDMWYYFGFDFAGPGGVSQTLTGKGDNTAYAAFVNADWAITDKLTLNLGGRYTDEEKTLDGGSPGWSFTDKNVIGAPAGSVVVAPGPIQNNKEDWAEFTPRIALSYAATDDLMVFGSYAKGFKSGGFFARTTDLINLESYDPEYVNTYELGMKSEWLDNRIRFNGTIFFTDYEDKQEDIIQAAPDGTVGTVVVNASDAEMYGVELELTAAVTANLNMFLQLGTLKSEYKNYITDISGDGTATDNSHLDIRNAPEMTFGIGANYVRDVSFGEVLLNYNYNWRDDYTSSVTNEDIGEIEAAGFHSASADLTFMDHYTVSIYGRNLSDERYKRAVGIPPVSTFAYYNAPRNFGIEFTAQF
jgi:iron complex outermembrane receptor protein